MRTFRGMPKSQRQKQRQRQKNQILFENQNLIEGVPSVGCRSLKALDFPLGRRHHKLRADLRCRLIRLSR